MSRLLSLLATGCASAPAALPSSTTAPEPATTVVETASPTSPIDTAAEVAGPSLAIVLLPDTAPVGSLLELDVNVENFTFVDPTAVPPPVGEGHYHVWIDGVLAGAAWEAVVDLDTTGLAVGPHELAVTLETSEHQALTPPVEAAATLTLE